MTEDGDSPPLPAVRLVRAVLEAAAEAGEAVEALQPPLPTVDVGTTESAVVHREHGIELHRYEPDERRHETPILVVYALVNRPYILDLQPDRSVVRRLLEAGFPVYLIDWGGPSRLDVRLGLSDYVGRYLDNCVDATLADAGTDDCHLLGYCMGGTMAAMYAALEDENLRTLTTMATPFAFDGTGGILEQWATHLDPEALVATYGNVPGEFLAVTFAMMEPVQHTLGKLVRLYENADDPEFVANFLRMERWIWDGVDVPGAVFREFVGDLYQDDALVAGTFELDGEPLDLGGVDVPAQHLVGEHDHLVPPASTRPLADALGSDDSRVVEFPVGHVGLSVSGAAHADLWPDVADWLAERSDPAGGPRRVGSDASSTGDDDRARAKATVEALSRRAAAKISADGGDAVGTAGVSDTDGPSPDRGEPEIEAHDSPPVQSIAGIGATYARRLGAAGVETVADLRRHDAAELAVFADTSRGRAARWLERAE